MHSLQELIAKGYAPVWMTEAGYTTLCGGYLLPFETPYAMFTRVARACAERLGKLELESIFFELLWKGWLGGASPVLSNMGTNRGLPISCYSVHVEDSIFNIFQKQQELALLSKHGGGVGIFFGDIRPRGSIISGNGKSEGVVPWAKCFDSTTAAVSQGSTRRGASALYLPFSHGDIDEFIDLRRTTGDINRRVHNIHHAVTITDEEMKNITSGDLSARSRWIKLLSTRVETGEPYIMFTDTVQKADPESYKALNLKTKTSNICTEIVAHTDPDHTFVCCLSSQNLAKWDEWSHHRFFNGMSVPEASTWMLQAVMFEFIEKAKKIEGMESAVRFAEKSQMLGLGAMGWHTLLQSKRIAFDSFDAMMLNSKVFSFIQSEAKKASRDMAREYGEPEWCKGFGVRNTHLTAIAPNVSNAIICGEVSESIGTITANAYALKSAKGVFIKKNLELEKILVERNENTTETWDQIIKAQGSVQGLKCLTADEKEVFKTAREINQFAIINQAAQRQKFICQSQSLNLFFTSGASAKYINDVHLHAWKSGIKTLYYLRSETVLKGSKIEYTKDECKACEG